MVALNSLYFLLISACCSVKASFSRFLSSYIMRLYSSHCYFAFTALSSALASFRSPYAALAFS